MNPSQSSTPPAAQKTVFRPKPKRQIASLKVMGMVAQHLGDRNEQQDRVSIFTSPSAPKCALAVLADGLGGRSGGAIAAETVLLTAERLFQEFTPATAPTHFFTNLVHEAHTSIRVAAFASRMDPHSTLVALLIQPDRVDWCHVGDSRLYAFRAGRLVHQTEDDTMAMKMVRDGQISSERARLHPSAGKLSQALGASSAPKANIGGLPDAQNSDRFLLCSDGLWTYFQPNELEYLLHHTTGSSRTRLLVEEARSRAHGHGDNCSLCIVELANTNENIASENLASEPR